MPPTPTPPPPKTPPPGQQQQAGKDRFKRGARPTPRHVLLGAKPYHRLAPVPPQFALVPQQLDMWGNDQYGDCVSAEEAFAKACYSPELFVSAEEVVKWAETYGYRDGADLGSVLDSMAAHGFQADYQRYNDGPKLGVDYSNEAVLQAAISDPAAAGPVKIAIDADALPAGAGNQSGWSAFGGSPGQFGNTDHCVSLCGYGPTAWLFQQLGAPVPSGAPSNGYLLYTWKTIGVVDHAWLMSTCTEAWTRHPTTVGDPPLPGPTPPPTPVPPGPGPAPAPGPGPWPAPTPTPPGPVHPIVCEGITLLLRWATPGGVWWSVLAGLAAALGCVGQRQQGQQGQGQRGASNPPGR